MTNIPVPPEHPRLRQPAETPPPSNPNPAHPGPANPGPSNTNRTAALIVAAAGAALLVAAAGTFIALSWDRLGLSGKAGVVALVAIAALAGGRALATRLPGVASVLTHLGGFLIPIDVGGVVTALGVPRPEVGIIAGTVGVIVLTVLERVGTGGAAEAIQRSPFMAAGRVLSIGGAALGIAALVGGPPAVPLLIAGIIALGIRERRDALGLALLAGSAPALALAAVPSKSGSFVDWLAELTELTTLETALVALAAIVLAGAASREWPGFLVGSTVLVLAIPELVDAVGTYRTEALVVAAAIILVARGAVLRFRTVQFTPLVDVAAFIVGAVALGASILSVSRPDTGLMACGLLLALTWIASDIESGLRLDPSAGWQRWLWEGATGAASTAGLALAFGSIALESGDPIVAAVIIAAFSITIGFSRRQGAGIVPALGLPIATGLALEDARVLLAFGLASAFLLQAKGMLNLLRGGTPASATGAQIVGVTSAFLAVLGYALRSNDLSHLTNLAAAASIVGTAVVLAATADRLPIPDLSFRARLLGPAALFVLWPDLTEAGLIGLAIAVLLALDAWARRVAGTEELAAATMILSSWLLAVGEGAGFLEAYVAGPAIALAWFGYRAMANGAGSWLGLGSGIGLLGGTAVIERMAEGPAWHAAIAGSIGLGALGIGLERRWAGPAVVGALLLISAVVIEAAAVVPRIPVWMLLALGGLLLLGSGALLERRAGAGVGASLRATLADFH